MFNKKDIVGWLWNVAIVDDHNGGYWLVDWPWCNRCVHVR